MGNITLTLNQRQAAALRAGLLLFKNVRGSEGEIEAMDIASGDDAFGALDDAEIDDLMVTMEQRAEEVLIGVFVEGGMVQDVTIPTAFAGRVIVMDFDTDGADDDQLVRVPLLDGAGRMTGERSGVVVGVYDGSAVNGSLEQLLSVLAQTDAGLGADMAVYGRGGPRDAGMERYLESECRDG